MKKNSLKFLIFTLIICATISCYEPNEACLDFYASNYELSADSDCDDCCEFPDLIMQFSHRFDSIAFEANDTIIDDFGNAFSFREFGFLISNIELIDDAGASHFIEDSILISSGGSSSYYKNDFDLVATGTSSYNIGIIKIAEPIDRIKFTLGVEIDDIDFTNLDSEFVLNQLDETYVDEEQFIPWNLKIERDTISSMIHIIQADVTDKRAIEISKELNSVLGSDIRVPINIEYRKLLEGVNMSSSTDQEIKALINANFDKTFR